MFKCKHKPFRGLSKEPYVKSVAESMGYGFYDYYRVVVTEHVCQFCKVIYVDLHKIDEKSAEVGPQKCADQIMKSVGEGS